MRTDELIHFLAPTMADHGLVLEKASDAEIYGDRPAWLIIYRGKDCKAQLCGSERDGGIDFMLAPLSASNTFGLSDRTTWQFMLLLSSAEDDLPTPGLRASNAEMMTWLRDLFLFHFDSASAALQLHVEAVAGEDERSREAP